MNTKRFYLFVIVLNFSVSHGKSVGKDQFPYYLMVETLYGDHWIESCSATLIAAKWALLLAKCINEYCDQRVIIDSLSIKYRETNETTELIEAEKGFKHPDYKVNRYNIGLLKLKSEISRSKAINLPRNLADCASTEGIIVGKFSSAWWLKGMYPSTLQYLKLPLISSQQCGDFLVKNNASIDFNDQMICTTMTEGEALCEGFSLPLLMEKSHKLHGLLLYVSRNCEVAVYTNVCRHIDWINHIMSNYTQ